MNKPLAAIAILFSALAVYLPTRTQAFTRVTIEGRSVRMLMSGRGETIVVFESGGGATLEMWGKVQPAVSRFAKTVSYDRAGLGLSDPAPRMRDGRRIAQDLRRALHAAGLAPPYILVGASMGGRYVRTFAAMHPEDVASIVLVDPTPDREVKDDETSIPDPAGIPVFLIDAVSPLEVPFATGAIRMLRMSNRADIDAESAEFKAWLDRIPGSTLIVTHRSGHNVPIEQPALVIDTIRQAVDEVTRR